jgi:hypothetical protein
MGGCLTPVQRLAGHLARLGVSLLGVVWWVSARIRRVLELFDVFWRSLAFLAFLARRPGQTTWSDGLVRLGRKTRLAFRVGPGISRIVRALRRLPLSSPFGKLSLLRAVSRGHSRARPSARLLYLLWLAELALFPGDGAAVLAAVAAGLVFGFLLALATHNPTSPVKDAARAGLSVRPGHW